MFDSDEIPGSMLPLLCHKRIGVVGLFWRMQQGHRSRLLANSTVSLRRMVAIELATWRSGRIGGAAGSMILGKSRRLALRGGARS